MNTSDIITSVSVIKHVACECILKAAACEAVMNPWPVDSEPKGARDGVHVCAGHLLRPAEGEFETLKGQNHRGPGCPAGQNFTIIHVFKWGGVTECLIVYSQQFSDSFSYFSHQDFWVQNILDVSFLLLLTLIIWSFGVLDCLIRQSHSCRTSRSWWTMMTMAIYYRSSPSQFKIAPLCS